MYKDVNTCQKTFQDLQSTITYILPFCKLRAFVLVLCLSRCARFSFTYISLELAVKVLPADLFTEL